MEFDFSPYVLRKKNSSEVQQGVLLRISDKGTWGFADVCPHIHLGDKSVKEEIKSESALFERAFELAHEDLDARLMRRSLLQDKPVDNNFLITDYRAESLNAFPVGATVKIKADKDFTALISLLNEVRQDLILRIDFNSKLSVEEYDFFLQNLTSVAKSKIEYIEDPTAFCDKWKEWNKIIPLAADFEKLKTLNCATYRIFKPAREEVDDSFENYTLTSAMDHPVGVAHGLRIAQRYAKNISGFLTLDLFEPTPFGKYFLQTNNLLNFSDLALRDYGIGMSDELQKLEWISLERFLRD